jgi:hypothetical protein
MQFRARLAQVNGTAPRTEDASNVISIKLEPQQLLEADWLFSQLGSYVLVSLKDAPPERTPIEDAIDHALAR